MSRRILVAGTASGCGKTTAVCGILYGLKKRGLQVAAWKSGPDYIDPMFHKRVLGSASGNLDLFFSGTERVRDLVSQREQYTDITVIEGAMGYYDGIGMGQEASCHALAQAVEAPVILVVDPRGMGSSVLALLQGFLQYRTPNRIAGILLNQVSRGQYERLAPCIEALGPSCLGYIPKQGVFSLESRHLGLVTADEVTEFQEKLEQFYELIQYTIEWEKLLALSEKAMPLFAPSQSAVTIDRKPLALTLGVARDEAFCFLYEDNLRYLEKRGCQIRYFSPLHEQTLPGDIDGLLLCGGYPELYAEALSQNTAMRQALKRAIKEGMPYVAECGGFLYLQQTLEDEAGKVYPMAGALPGHGSRKKTLRRFGYVELSLQEGALFGRESMTLRAHEFHYCECDQPGSAWLAKKASGEASWMTGTVNDNGYAGFPHIYYYGNEEFAEGFLERCELFCQKRASLWKSPYEAMGRVPDLNAERNASERWDRVAKPLHGLGRLEELLIRIAGIQGSEKIAIEKRAMLVFCGDNGITAQGVTQTDSHVTAVVTKNIAEGKASVCKMCQIGSTEVVAIDMGVGERINSPRLLDRAVAQGTRDFSREPAMSREEVLQAVNTGIELVRAYGEQGYTLLGTGEMGIGNTTTASAVAISLLDLPLEESVGRGAGLSEAGLLRKRKVIGDAIERYQLRKKPALEVLACVGGFDIAGMAGAFIGGSQYGIPIVIDGMISAVAALAAVRLCPAAIHCMLPSHISKEPCMRAVMQELGLHPIIDGELALGEGTGAALLFPMLDMAKQVYRSRETFEQIQIESYQELT